MATTNTGACHRKIDQNTFQKSPGECMGRPKINEKSILGAPGAFRVISGEPRGSPRALLERPGAAQERF